MSNEMVLQTLEGGLLTITMNRPDRRNALNPDMTQGLVEAARRAQDDTEVRAVLIRGAGGTFCVGGDVKSMAAGRAPLPGALLLPRGQMPLNIFEPRYLAMIDDALRDGHRLIGMIQPDVAHSHKEARPALFRIGCVGRITQLAESGDGRYILELTGISRFKVIQELEVLTAYRQCKVDFFAFADDFTARMGEDAVNREALLVAFFLAGLVVLGGQQQWWLQPVLQSVRAIK